MKAKTFATTVIVSALTLCSGVLGYGIVRHQRVLTWQLGQNHSAYTGIFIFYILPVVFIIGLAPLLRRRDEVSINVAILIVSIVLLLYCFEGGLLAVDLLYPPPKKARAKIQAKLAKQGKTFDSRSPLEMLHFLRQQEQRAFLAINPYHFRVPNSPEMWAEADLEGANREKVFPLAGISQVTTLLCHENGEWIVYESDEHGFHNPKGLYQPGNVAIAAIGDSFTQGICVPSETNAIEVLRTYYPQIINLGMSGSGPLIELAIFREFVEPLRPRIVLWLYFPNDLGDLETEKRGEFWMRYLDPHYTQNFWSLQPELDSYLIDFHTSKEREMEQLLKQQQAQKRLGQTGPIISRMQDFALLRHVRANLNLRFIPPSEHAFENRPMYVYEGKNYEFDIELFRKILTFSRDACATWEGKLYFVDLPTYEYVKMGTFPQAHETVRTIVEELGIPGIDVYAAFMAHDDPLVLFPFRLPGHYSEEGYKVVAQTILDTIH